VTALSAPSTTGASFVEEATKIVDAAKEKGIALRIMGATAVRIHCSKFSYLHDALQREITDIDFVGYGKQNSNVLKLLDALGYVSDKRMRMFQFMGRYLFENPANKRHIDVFFDKLEFCHTIDFKGRLELDYPTISLSDILLQKMQIVQINEKDIRDTMVLLRGRLGILLYGHYEPRQGASVPTRIPGAISRRQVRYQRQDRPTFRSHRETREIRSVEDKG
jgi:hypothetical protein